MSGRKQPLITQEQAPKGWPTRREVHIAGLILLCYSKGEGGQKAFFLCLNMQDLRLQPLLRLVRQATWLDRVGSCLLSKHPAPPLQCTQVACFITGHACSLIVWCKVRPCNYDNWFKYIPVLPPASVNPTLWQVSQTCCLHPHKLMQMLMLWDARHLAGASVADWQADGQARLTAYQGSHARQSHFGVCFGIKEAKRGPPCIQPLSAQGLCRHPS